jgi:hypothetical protein
MPSMRPSCFTSTVPLGILLFLKVKETFPAGELLWREPEITLPKLWRLVPLCEIQLGGMLTHSMLPMVQMKIAEVTKMSTRKPGHAADRVILMPCSLEPEDPQTLPFMRKRVVVKTLQLPHDLFYLDRALTVRYESRQRGEPMRDHDYDFTQVNTLDFHNINMWPLIQPLCLQLESMPLESGGYHLFSTNCYFFARTIFYALEYAHAGRWDVISQDELDTVLREALGHPTLKPQKDEKLTPLQRAALWFNSTLSGTTDMGDLIKQTAKDMAEGMQNCAHYGEIVGSVLKSSPLEIFSTEGSSADLWMRMTVQISLH